MDWLELLLAIGSVACSVFLFIKNRALSMNMEQFKTEIAKKKVLYTICPKCGAKIYLTIDNVQEEVQDGGTEI